MGYFNRNRIRNKIRKQPRKLPRKQFKKQSKKLTRKSVIITLIVALVIGTFIGVFGSADLIDRSWQKVANYTSSNQCDIKGNINSKGVRIYHVPGDDYYSATIINPARGEKWFCSELEAKLAGWRRSRV